ncbi:hypothetical protein BdWA1_001105 [Babesia duncani]|uniref:Uncharacterized protein n=1 Tax=Babesia duncani TaxID=323732 RepID=A0AAD9UQN3_9APIC|nr:hypothetical protein BdWA1_001105 [Babesia duncani]
MANMESTPMRGRFSLADECRLTAAINAYIRDNFTCDRKSAIKALTKKRGREPSILTSISHTLLPGRDPKSIYNFVRRRLGTCNDRSWSSKQLFELLRAYFKAEKDVAADQSVAIHNRWSNLAGVLNKSPEQIHDKWKRVKPFLEDYRTIIENDSLTNNEKIELLERNSKVQRHISKDLQGEIYNVVTSMIEDGTIKEPILQNIPWPKVQEHFKKYSLRQIRNYFNQTLIPRLLKHAFPGFGPDFTARVAIATLDQILHQSTPPEQSTPVGPLKEPPDSIECNHKRPGYFSELARLRFHAHLPQLPSSYVRKCTRQSLWKCDKEYGSVSTLKVALERAYKLLQIEKFKAWDLELLNSISTRALPQFIA